MKKVMVMENFHHLGHHLVPHSVVVVALAHLVVALAHLVVALVVAHLGPHLVVALVVGHLGPHLVVAFHLVVALVGVHFMDLLTSVKVDF